MLFLVKDKLNILLQIWHIYMNEIQLCKLDNIYIGNMDLLWWFDSCFTSQSLTTNTQQLSASPQLSSRPTISSPLASPPVSSPGAISTPGSPMSPRSWNTKVTVTIPERKVELTPMTRILHSKPIWYLPDRQRVAATHYLQPHPVGVSLFVCLFVCVCVCVCVCIMVHSSQKLLKADLRLWWNQKRPKYSWESWQNQIWTNWLR